MYGLPPSQLTLVLLLFVHASSTVQFGSQQGASRPLVEELYSEQQQQPLDGASMVPVWLSQPTKPCSEALPFVSTKYKFIQCLSPKAGSVEWHKLINWMELGERRLVGGWNDCGLTVASAFNFSHLEVSKVLTSSDYYKFTVVRNPVVRLLSATLHKGVGRKASPQQFHKFMCSSILSTTSEEGMLQHTCAGDAPGNLHGKWQHWYPQHCRCGMAEGVVYDRLVHMEDMETQLGELATRGLIPRNFTATGWGKKGNSPFFSDKAKQSQDKTHRMDAIAKMGRWVPSTAVPSTGYAGSFD
jgi:hypothetical protein